MLLASALALLAAPSLAPETIAFPSGDGLEITADVYRGEAAEGAKRPLVVLFHQAGWSRGEYREIAPRLVELGYDCMAVDARSGKEVNGVPNETAKRALEAGKPTAFADAEPDLVASLAHAREHLARGAPVVAWGSSYSASLVLRLAGTRPELADGWVAFAPGEYFGAERATWVREAAAKIEEPVFVTSAKAEADAWEAIWKAIPSEKKVRWLPETAGNHGSRALWKQFDDSAGYWKSVEGFLAEHVPGGKR